MSEELKKNKNIKLSNKLEIFILTYNRKEFLKKSIQSIINSSYKDVKLTIIDNASVDGTDELLLKFKENYSNIYSIRQSKCSKTAWYNIQTAIKNANSEYVMIFHDDDVLHFQYIEAVLDILNSENDVDLICSARNVFTDEKDVQQIKYKNIRYKIYKDKLDFASIVFINKFGKDLCFPNIVYKTQNFKNIIEEYQAQKYGKIGDKVLALETVKNGKCIFINNKMMNYRQHANQDTYSEGTGPFDEEIINFMQYFKDLLKGRLYSKFIYNIHSLYWIKSLNKWGYKGRNLQILAKKLYDNKIISNYTFSIVVSNFNLLFRLVNCIIKKSIRI